MSLTDSLMANSMMGTIIETRILERTRRALARISWLGSCKCTTPILISPTWPTISYQDKKHLKNVGPIHHCESPHAHSPCVASGTVACHLRIDVHDNDNAWQRGPLWPHGMGPMTLSPPPLLFSISKPRLTSSSSVFFSTSSWQWPLTGNRFAVFWKLQLDMLSCR